jgi:recombination protein RecT
MSTALAPMEAKILSFETNFNAVNAYRLNFKKEASFALQLLKANDFLRKTAQDNQESLQAAITNIAAIGISLNPATKEAYLVPRKNAICLDISAIGLVKLATDSGSIKWVQAELVRTKDKFEYMGVGKMPLHQMDPFSDRGEIIGVYVVAKTVDNDLLVTVMSAKECHDIRDRSEAWKAYKSGKVSTCPWVTDEGEMMKKTVIKRASKLWPKSERLDTAVSVINEHEGIEFGSQGPHVDKSAYDGEVPTEDSFGQLRKVLESKGKTEEGLLKYLNTQFKSNIEKLEELNSAQVEYAYRMLGGKQ